MIDVRGLLSHILWIVAIFLVLSCTGQNDRHRGEVKDLNITAEDTEIQPVITFDRLSHDFGSIIEGEQVVCYFGYKNNGATELILTSVEATCGCTTPDWSSEPLESGKKTSLKIIFDATNRSGSQRKVVTVISNASNSTVKLTILANIET